MIPALPRIDIDKQAIDRKVDARNDVFGYDSSINGTSYAADRDAMLVYSYHNGYLKIPYKDMPTLIEELQNIYEDMRYRNAVNWIAAGRGIKR